MASGLMMLIITAARFSRQICPTGCKISRRWRSCPAFHSVGSIRLQL